MVMSFTAMYFATHIDGYIVIEKLVEGESTWSARQRYDWLTVLPRNENGEFLAIGVAESRDDSLGVSLYENKWRGALRMTIGRFAPTPSGRMHIGNIYAMLGAWLSAHMQDGSQTAYSASNAGTDAHESAVVEPTAVADGGSDGEVVFEAKNDTVSIHGLNQTRSSIQNHSQNLDQINSTPHKSTQGQAQDQSKSKNNLGIRRPGTVLLRIEDIDTPRNLPDADRWIMDDLDWLGLHWDGEPIYQSRRTELYEAAFQALCQRCIQGDADAMPLVYPCFCSRADIRAASAPQEGDRFIVYPGTCRSLLMQHRDTVSKRLDRNERHSWRIAMPRPGNKESSVTIHDRVFGKRSFMLASDIGDTVIRRSDGIFAYQLAVVVDDMFMGVDDIVRGRDLLRSAALQTWIRSQLIASGFGDDVSRAFANSDNESLVQQAASLQATSQMERSGQPQQPASTVYSERSDSGRTMQSSDGSSSTYLPTSRNHQRNCGLMSEVSPLNPAYAHLPLIDNAQGARLAKRERSVDMAAIRDSGAAPEQVIGYAAWLLGLRAPGEERPIPLSPDDALALFSWDVIRNQRGDRRVGSSVLPDIQPADCNKSH